MKSFQKLPHLRFAVEISNQISDLPLFTQDWQKLFQSILLGILLCDRQSIVIASKN